MEDKPPEYPSNPPPEGHVQMQQYPPQPQQYAQGQQQMMMQQQQQQPGANVVMVQPGYAQPQTVVVQQQIKPSSYLGFSICICLCCNPILGCIAIVMACMSDSAYSSGDIDAARTYGNCAKWLSIVSIILFFVGIIVLIIVLVAFVGIFASSVTKGLSG